MGSPVLSIIVTCYNQELYLGATLDSLFSQDCSGEVEIIVVDDGSTDRSVDIASTYIDRGLKLIQQTNQGQCAAANTGYRASQGAYIKFFDADDIMHPHMLRLQIDALKDDTSSIAMGEWTRFYGHAPANEAFLPLTMYCNAHPVDWLIQEWHNARPMMQCGLWLIPRRVIEASGLWDESLSLANDFEFFTRVLLKCEHIIYTPDAKMYYRSGLPQSLSRRKDVKSVRSEFQSISSGVDLLIASENSPRAKRASANILKNFDYNYYPHHSHLRRLARKRVSELGGSTLEPDGPPGFHLLRKFLGWQSARLVQRVAEKLGLNEVARLKWALDRDRGS